VVLESKYGSPRIVNDGVTVAKEVELEDPVENIGAKLVRQVGVKDAPPLSPQSLSEPLHAPGVRQMRPLLAGLLEAPKAFSRAACLSPFGDFNALLAPAPGRSVDIIRPSWPVSKRQRPAAWSPNSISLHPAAGHFQHPAAVQSVLLEP
jgi:hypothetical protein